MLKKLSALLLSGILVCTLVSLVKAKSAAPHNCGAVSSNDTNVKVTPRREGNVTKFYVQNSERSEVTMTFDFKIENLKSDVEFPYTKTFGPGESEAFALSPVDASVDWDYSYTNYYKLGSSVAVPDDSVYLLPYEAGTSFRVTQGYNGEFSHTGANQYSIDWKMPEGTPVRAARGGLVVKTKDDSDKGGGSMAYDKYNNYVLIRHDDGTLAHYCHLKKGGVSVKPGETVKAGDLIALSGNTGFSSGPHLHFCVFKTRDGKTRESIPVRFRDADQDSITLTEGRKYKASPVPTTETRTPAVHAKAENASRDPETVVQ